MRPSTVPAVLAFAAAGAAVLAACSSSGSGAPTTTASVLPSFTASAGSTINTTFSPTLTAPVTASTSSAPSTSASASATASSVSVKQPPAHPLSEKTVTSTDGKRSYDLKVWVQVDTSDCADHAYGNPVIQYLTAHPCHGMTRLLATTSVGGRSVGIAQSTVGFIGTPPQVYQTAGDFATLVNADGTGNVNDLLREGYRVPNGPSTVPQPDAFNVQSQDSAVTIVDAFYLDGSTPVNDKALITMARDIYLQF